jgi:hypothetical protein
MYKYKLSLPGIPPFSINKAYYKTTFTKTRECRDWSTEVLLALSTAGNQAVMRAINQSWASNVGIAVKFVFYIPKEIFFTKAGTISSKCHDLTNIEKLLLDLICDEKKAVGNMRNLAINDKNVVHCISKKKPANIYHIDVFFKLELLNDKIRQFPT